MAARGTKRGRAAVTHWFLIRFLWDKWSAGGSSVLLYCKIPKCATALETLRVALNVREANQAAAVARLSAIPAVRLPLEQAHPALRRIFLLDEADNGGELLRRYAVDATWHQPVPVHMLFAWALMDAAGLSFALWSTVLFAPQPFVPAAPDNGLLLCQTLEPFLAPRTVCRRARFESKRSLLRLRRLLAQFERHFVAQLRRYAGAVERIGEHFAQAVYLRQRALLVDLMPPEPMVRVSLMVWGPEVPLPAAGALGDALIEAPPLEISDVLIAELAVLPVASPEDAVIARARLIKLLE